MKLTQAEIERVQEFERARTRRLVKIHMWLDRDIYDIADQDARDDMRWLLEEIERLENERE